MFEIAKVNLDNTLVHVLRGLVSHFLLFLHRFK